MSDFKKNDITANNSHIGDINNISIVNGYYKFPKFPKIKSEYNNYQENLNSNAINEDKYKIIENLTNPSYDIKNIIVDQIINFSLIEVNYKGRLSDNNYFIEKQKIFNSSNFINDFSKDNYFNEKLHRFNHFKFPEKTILDLNNIKLKLDNYLEEEKNKLSEFLVNNNDNAKNEFNKEYTNYLNQVENVNIAYIKYKTITQEIRTKEELLNLQKINIDIENYTNLKSKFIEFQENLNKKENLEKRISDLKIQLEKIKEGDTENLNKKLEVIKISHSNNKSKFNEYTTKLQDLENKKTELQNNEKNLNKEIEKLNSDLEVLQNNEKKYKERILELKTILYDYGFKDPKDYPEIEKKLNEEIKKNEIEHRNIQQDIGNKKNEADKKFKEELNKLKKEYLIWDNYYGYKYEKLQNLSDKSKYEKGKEYIERQKKEEYSKIDNELKKNEFLLDEKKKKINKIKEYNDLINSLEKSNNNIKNVNKELTKIEQEHSEIKNENIKVNENIEKIKQINQKILNDISELETNYNLINKDLEKEIQNENERKNILLQIEEFKNNSLKTNTEIEIFYNDFYEFTNIPLNIAIKENLFSLIINNFNSWINDILEKINSNKNQLIGKIIESEIFKKLEDSINNLKFIYDNHINETEQIIKKVDLIIFNYKKCEDEKIRENKENINLEFEKIKKEINELEKSFENQIISIENLGKKRLESIFNYSNEYNDWYLAELSEDEFQKLFINSKLHKERYDILFVYGYIGKKLHELSEDEFQKILNEQKQKFENNQLHEKRYNELIKYINYVGDTLDKLTENEYKILLLKAKLTKTKNDIIFFIIKIFPKSEKFNKILINLTFKKLLFYGLIILFLIIPFNNFDFKNRFLFSVFIILFFYLWNLKKIWVRILIISPILILVLSVLLKPKEISLTKLYYPSISNSKYPNCDTNDIQLENGQIWASCNVGAINSYKGLDLQTLTASGIVNKKIYAGDFFHLRINQDLTGLCEKGYHIPSLNEWINAINLYKTTNLSLFKILKLPFAGAHVKINSKDIYTKQGTHGFYWTSTPQKNKLSVIYFDGDKIDTEYSADNNYGLSIRCIKDY